MSGRELQNAEEPIDRAIAEALIEATPEWWNSIMLEISHVEHPAASGYRHRLWSPDGHKDRVEITEALLAQMRKLAALFEEAGHPWRKATYKVTIEPNKDYVYVVDCDYYEAGH
jgi:predicted GNAT superfamily acetyltransferase